MAANRRTFIIRIWQNEDGNVIGQISDPQEGWRRPFADAAELWQMLTAQPRGESSSGPVETDEDSEN